MKTNTSARFLALLTLVISASSCGPTHENAATGAPVGGAADVGIDATIGDPSGKTALDPQEQDDVIAQQREAMKKQEQELQDLKRQKFHDDYFRSQYQQ